MCSFLEMVISVLLGLTTYVVFLYGLAWVGALGRDEEYEEFEKECRERNQFKEGEG